MNKKMDIYAELDDFVEENEGQVTLTDVAKHFAEYGYQYAQTHPNWISVEDELPKEENLYIVSNGRETSVAYWVDDNWDTFGDVITHWIQLPKPPRKEE